jgi:hypothetical protein
MLDESIGANWLCIVRVARVRIERSPGYAFKRRFVRMTGGARQYNQRL